MDESCAVVSSDEDGMDWRGRLEAGLHAGRCMIVDRVNPSCETRREVLNI